MTEQTKDNIALFMRITGMFDDVTTAMRNQEKQLAEEVKELYLGVIDNNALEILDGIGDCVFVDTTIDLLNEKAAVAPFAPCESFFTYRGLMYTLQPTDALVSACLASVVLSNLSKFDYTTAEATLTQAHYTALGVDVIVNYDEAGQLYYTRAKADCTDVNGKTYHKGKVLKSIVNYEAPDFTEILAAIGE